MPTVKWLGDPWVRRQFLLMGLVLLGAPAVSHLINLGPLDPVLGQMDPFLIRAAGWLILAAGVGLIGWSKAALGPALTPSVTPVEGAPLARGGPYARVRHPMYTGLILLLAGYTLGVANWRLALLVGWIAGLFFGAKASAEERLLEMRFPDYREYRRWVPKLVPWGKTRD